MTKGNPPATNPAKKPINKISLPSKTTSSYICSCLSAGKALKSRVDRALSYWISSCEVAVELLEETSCKRLSSLELTNQPFPNQFKTVFPTLKQKLSNFPWLPCISPIPFPTL